VFEAITPFGGLQQQTREAPTASPSHGENRGSSPLGSANDFNSLAGCQPASDGGYLFFVYYLIRRFFRRTVPSEASCEGERGLFL
jgi:hypothetical protein